MRRLAKGSCSKARLHRVAVLRRFKPDDFDLVRTFVMSRGLSFNDAIVEIIRSAGLRLVERAAERKAEA
jgi:hypothetical protein